METRKSRAPVLKHLDELTRRDLVRHIMLHDVSETGADANGGSRQVAVIGGKRPVGVDLDLLAILLELPGQQATRGRRPVADAGMAVEIIWRQRRRVA